MVWSIYADLSVILKRMWLSWKYGERGMRNSYSTGVRNLCKRTESEGAAWGQSLFTLGYRLEYYTSYPPMFWAISACAVYDWFLLSYNYM